MAAPRPAPNHRVLWTFAISSIALFMAALDNLVVTTALPVIRASFQANLAELEWIVNAYTLTFAVLLLTGAALGDRFGRKRLFIIGLAIFTGGSAIAALSSSVGVLIAARAIQGLGGAILTPLSLTILSAAVPRERRAVALGAWGGIAGLAIAIGPLVGGAISEGRPAAPRPVSTCRASGSSAAASSRSSGAWFGPTSRAGQMARSSARSRSASSSS